MTPRRGAENVELSDSVTVESGKVSDDSMDGGSASRHLAISWVQTAPLLLAWALLIWHLSVFWTLAPQYQFGWTVVPLALYLCWRRAGEIDTPSRDCRGAAFVAFFGAALLLPVWWIRVATPDWSVVSYTLAGLVFVFTIAVLASRTSWSAAWQMAAPMALIFVAIPWPHRAETVVIQTLTRTVAACTAEILQWFGVAAEPQGNLITLTTGTIGISEACSGLRSIQSMLLAALAIGELFRLSLGRRCALVLSGTVLAIFLNLVRNVVLSLIAFSRGIATMESWHDPAGWLILLLLLPPLFFLARRLQRASAPELSRDRGVPWQPMPMWNVAILSLWLVGIAAGVECWYRAHEHRSMAFRPLEIQWPTQAEHFQASPIPDRTRDILLCSKARSAAWREDDQTSWALTAVEWAPRETSPQFARVHRPEACLQAVGLTLIQKMPPRRFDLANGSLLFEPLELRIAQEPIYVFFSLYEAANRDDASDFQETAWSRIEHAIRGQRNAGQQMIEIRVSGYPSYESAATAVASRVPGLIRAAASEAESR